MNKRNISVIKDAEGHNIVVINDIILKEKEILIGTKLNYI